MKTPPMFTERPRGSTASVEKRSGPPVGRTLARQRGARDKEFDIALDQVLAPLVVVARPLMIEMQQPRGEAQGARPIRVQAPSPRPVRSSAAEEDASRMRHNAPAQTIGSNVVTHTPEAPPAVAAATPPDEAMLVERDTQVLMTPHATRIRVETPEDGTMAIRVQMAAGITRVELSGVRTDRMDAYAHEIRATLQSAGMTVGHVGVSRDTSGARSDSSADEHEPHEPSTLSRGRQARSNRRRHVVRA